MKPFEEALQFAKEFDSKLICTDFDHYVVIHHGDGTTLNYNNAIAVKWKQYILVFTEHHQYYVYPKDELKYYEQYKPIGIKPLKNTGKKDKCDFCSKVFDIGDLKYDYHWCPGSDPMNSELTMATHKLYKFCVSCSKKGVKCPAGGHSLC